MEKRHISDYIAVIISVFSLILAGWAASTTYSNELLTLDIQNNSLKMQENIYRANQPFLNPIINVEISDFDVNITHGIPTETEVLNEDICTTWEFNISLIFKNYGEGIAQNTTFMVVMSDLINVNWIDLVGASISANDVYPGTSSNFPVTAKYSNCWLGEGVIYIENISDKVAFIVKSEYYDKVTHECLNQTYWFKYVISENKVYDLTIAEKNIFIEKYEEKFNKNFIEFLTLSPS